MLQIDVKKIPLEGMEVDSAVDPGAVHLEGEESFALKGGRLKARVERADDESVRVRGRLSARLGLDCGRCLEPFELPLDQELELFYLPHLPDQVEEADEVELSDRDMVVAYYRDHKLDLGEVVREQLFLTLPLKRLCHEDCQGLCPSCGVNRNTVTCACRVEEPVDPRLAPLRKLFDKD